MNHFCHRRIAALVFLSTAGSCAHSRELVRPFANSSGIVLVRDVAVLDVEIRERYEHRDVLVRGGVIVAVEPTGSLDAPAAATVIAGRDGTLLPGLIDMHVHLAAATRPAWELSLPDPEANLRSYLYCGVTTVLEAAGLDNDAVELRNAVRDGNLVGPRVYTAGPTFTATGGHPIPMLRLGAPSIIEGYLISHMTRQVGAPEDAQALVDEVAELGVDFIKVIIDRIPHGVPRLSPEAAAAVARAAEARNLRTIFHIGSTEDAKAAAGAGAAVWMHGVYKERIPEADVTSLAGFGIPMVPTLVVFASHGEAGRGKRAPTELEKEVVTAEDLAAYDEPPPEYFEPPVGPFVDMLHAERQTGQRNVRRLHAAGVTIIAGSDAQAGVFSGPGLHRELHLLAAAGLPPWEVIRAATLYPARFLAGDGPLRFGSVARGLRADLLLVDGDPLVDLSALQRIRSVMKDGVLLERKPVGGERWVVDTGHRAETR